MSKNNQVVRFKIGDVLAFQEGYSGDYYIYEIEHVTPTGIANVGPYKVNPDMTLRGKRGRGYYGPYKAEFVTDKISKIVERQKFLARVARTRWTNQPTDILKAICELIDSCGNTENRDDN